jgi:hypothetical protein
MLLMWSNDKARSGGTVIIGHGATFNIPWWMQHARLVVADVGRSRFGLVCCGGWMEALRFWVSVLA